MAVNSRSLKKHDEGRNYYLEGKLNVEEQNSIRTSRVDEQRYGPFVRRLLIDLDRVGSFAVSGRTTSQVISGLTYATQ
jgi:hypothetical protein